MAGAPRWMMRVAAQPWLPTQVSWPVLSAIYVAGVIVGNTAEGVYVDLREGYRRVRKGP